MRTWIALLVTVAALVPVSAFDATMGQRAIEEAIAIGQSRLGNERARFHAAYRVTVNHAPVDYVEAVTPFRRVALGAEANSRAGRGIFSLKEADQLLATSPGEVWIYAELTFHPLNTFITVPPYGLTLFARTVSVEPAGIVRLPRFGPRVEGVPLPTPNGNVLTLPGGSEPLAGATIIGRFGGARLESNGIYEAIVSDGTAELGRARIDFSKMR